MRFRDRHQDPDATDLEYAARDQRLRRRGRLHRGPPRAPWIASMVGFVAGLPFLYQMVPRERQLEVPKYVRPRTDTPALTVGHGGCFGCIYSVRGAGGYQMFGITPMPIYDPARAARLRRVRVLLRPGDIVKFEPIDRERYDELSEAPGGRPIRPPDVSFDLEEFVGRPRRLQRPAAGGARCRLRSSSPACPRRSRTAGREGYYHLGDPAVGRPGPVLADRGQPARGQRRGRRGAGVRLHGPGAALRRGRARSPWPAPTSSRGSTARSGELWTSFAVAAGADADLRPPARGARAYVAVAGGIDVPEVLGSRSTYALGALGGYDGRPLAGGRLAARSGAADGGGRRAAVPETLRPPLGTRGRDPRGHGPLRPPAHRRGPADLRSTTWTLTPDRRPRRLPLQGRGAGDARARAAVRRGQRPVEHRRRARTRSARSRSRAASSRSSCTATRSPAAATRWWPR